MEPKIITTETQYRETMTEIERLMALDPKAGTRDAERLSLLASLAEDYEKKRFFFSLPTPVEAIRFRMEEQGLSQADLIPIIGSKSKVSEVLSGKRTLSISMIRALNKELEIPLNVLIQDQASTNSEEMGEPTQVAWEKFPIREMQKRGWLGATLDEIKSKGERLIRDFIRPLSELSTDPLFRSNCSARSSKTMDQYALTAWTARVVGRAEPLISDLQPTRKVTEDFLHEIAHLSWSARGPLVAQELLLKNGIVLIIEPSLPHTHLDGASFLTKKGVAIIGMTLRYDRIDSFWFTLLHELAHVAYHLTSKEFAFFDDLDSEVESDPKEVEADRVAREAFIPRAKWMRCAAYRQKTPDSIIALADELRIHPAVIAGRIRYETKNFRILSDLLGQGKIRALFDDVEWSTG